MIPKQKKNTMNMLMVFIKYLYVMGKGFIVSTGDYLFIRI